MPFAGAVFTAAALAYAFLFATSGGQALLPPTLLGLPTLYVGIALKVLPALALAAIAGHGLRRLPPAFRAYGAATRNGLLLSAVGDALMDLADAGSEPAFLAGMAAFLAAHLAYAVGLLRNRGPHDLVVALGCYAPPLAVLNLLRKPMAAQPDAAQLLPAVVVYIGALAFVLYAAAIRRTDAKAGGPAAPSAASYAYWLPLIGSAIFMLSDACLAWDRFAPPPRTEDGAVRWWWRQPKLVVMLAYYAAQGCLAGGVWAAGSDGGKAAASAQAEQPRAKAGKQQ